MLNPLIFSQAAASSEALSRPAGICDRDHHLVQAELAERGVVDRRAEGVADRVADHGVDLGLGLSTWS